MSTGPQRLFLHIDGTRYETQLTSKYEKRKPYSVPDPNTLTAFIPGVIQKIHVRHGQKVKQGDSLLVLEAMKMQNTITAPRDGTVKVVLVSEGQKARKDQALLAFE